MSVDPTFAFNGKNTEAQTVAKRVAAKLVTRISRETRSAIRTVIVRSISEGIPVREAGRLIRSMVGMNGPQTAASAAYREQLIESGLRADKVEAALSRYVEKKIRERAEMIARTECLPAETLVDAAMVRAVFRRWYEGLSVKVGTSSGREFTATPNHPMLTNRGWVAARELTEGDYLICRAWGQHSRAARDEDVAHPPSTLGQIFDAAAAIGIIERGCGGEPDFHGDGRDGQIDVARPGRSLEFGANPTLYQESLQLALSPSDKAGAPLCSACGRLLSVYESSGLCDRTELYGCITEAAADSTIRNPEGLGEMLRRLTLPIAESDGGYRQVVTPRRAPPSAGEECLSGSGQCSELNASPSESPIDEIASRPDCPCRGGNAEPGFVQLDRVSSVLMAQWSGHVFNLSTMDGYYTINEGIYTGNCMYALNSGAEEGWRQATAEGWLDGTAKKEWIVTPDDALCDLCAPLDGKQVDLDADFPGGVSVPPLHPRCRCTLGLQP